MSGDKRIIKSQWQRTFKTALDSDIWGQREEAKEEYERLSRMIEADDEIQISPDERITVNKLRTAINLRIDSIQDIKGKDGISLNEIKLVQAIFADLFLRPVKFPIEVPSVYVSAKDSFSHDSQSEGVGYVKNEKKIDPSRQSVRGSLVQSSPSSREVAPGSTTLEVFIEKIGLKDAQTYFEPQINVLVIGPGGNIIEQEESAKSTRQKPNYVTFEQLFSLSSTIDFFQSGATLFFEFKHFKPKAKKVSTRCFAFMEYDEISRQNGKMTCLELYRKPTDFNKKKLNLFTIKKLFLHVQVTLHNH